VVGENLLSDRRSFLVLQHRREIDVHMGVPPADETLNCRGIVGLKDGNALRDDMSCHLPMRPLRRLLPALPE
jgi:hypothetical protein